MDTAIRSQSFPKPAVRLPIIPFHRNCCSFCSWCSRSLHWQQSGISTRVAGFKCSIWHGGSQHTPVSPVEPILRGRHSPRLVQVLLKQQNTVIHLQPPTDRELPCNLQWAPRLCSWPAGIRRIYRRYYWPTDRHDVGCHLYADDTQLY